jgi:hypoxanthine phosphoribosyltransferase
MMSEYIKTGPEYLELIEEVFLERDEIQNIIRGLAGRIVRDYSDKKEIDAVIILKGAKRFASDLIKNVKAIRPEIVIRQHFIRLSSYGSGTETSGNVRMQGELADVDGKDILVVEDIVDTGITLNFLLDYLRKKGAASVRICTLLDKPSRRLQKVHLDYTGKTIPNRFVIGYGIDWNERFRDLDYLAFLDEEKVKSFKLPEG